MRPGNVPDDGRFSNRPDQATILNFQMNSIMKRLTHLFSFLMAMLVLSQCDPSISERTADSGQADFSSYVAVGNSLTAGYSDNALHREGQINSFPNILAGQMQQAGGGEFLQPLVNPGVGSNAEGEARLVLQVTTGPDGSPTLSPAPAAESGQDIFSRQQTGPFHNVGVPGARSFHLVAEGYGNTEAGEGNYNPFFARFKSDPMATVLGDALMAEPTFFTLWAGNNDVLGYATAGGTGQGLEEMGDPAQVSDNDITPVNVFEGSIEALAGTLAGEGALGAVLSIPDVTTIPFFNTVPWDGLALTAEQAQMLRAGYEAEGVPEQLIPDFQEGANGFVIEDGDAPAGFRMAEQGEHILLSVPQDSLQPLPEGAGWGSSTPIPDQYTLTAEQAGNVRLATDTFNDILEGAASQLGLVFVDVNPELEAAAQEGVVYDAILLTTEFVEGGVFSLDGIHLTPRGAAMVTNMVIEEINETYGATVSPVNVSAYEGVRFP